MTAVPSAQYPVADLPDAPLGDAWLMEELRTDHAGETGAVAIYCGILAATRDPAVRAFAQEHRATEARHLAMMDALVPPARRSRLLPLWRLAGFVTGALPALMGARAVFVTVEAVETFVDAHLTAQIDALAARDVDHALLPVLRDCRDEERHHRDEAAERSGSPAGPLGRLWAGLIARGSAFAVALARRV